MEFDGAWYGGYRGVIPPSSFVRAAVVDTTVESGFCRVFSDCSACVQSFLVFGKLYEGLTQKLFGFCDQNLEEAYPWYGPIPSVGNGVELFTF